MSSLDNVSRAFKDHFPFFFIINEINRVAVTVLAYTWKVIFQSQNKYKNQQLAWMYSLQLKMKTRKSGSQLLSVTPRGRVPVYLKFQLSVCNLKTHPFLPTSDRFD